MLGHTMAIMSSSGAGYANPANFLPPNGLTTTILGQLLFSSRLAVDTFLCISGFLVVHVLSRKVAVRDGESLVFAYMASLPKLVITRVARILPLYALCVGFYTQIAPHMGSGPFWYQWLALLKPCHDYGWTNFLFINNFVPWDLPITDTCFYHSWYLAVDMQLFIFSALLVLLYQKNRKHGRRATVALILLSIAVSIYLAYVRQWSINTFDGAAVARFEVEAYAKPHIRAHAYLSGAFVAMVLFEEGPRSDWKLGHHFAIVVALFGMVFVTFVTAWGAYERRACQYQEWPGIDNCGSMWSASQTLWYTVLSRVVWSTGVCTIMYLSIGRRASGNWVAAVLSWKCWVPLSQLSFAVYLIHPVVIFVWQLGDREKEIFRLETFAMNWISVSVVSYAVALGAVLVVELPFAAMWKLWTTKRSNEDMGAPLPVVYGSTELSAA